CDPSCDRDGVSTPNGSCTFSIAVHVNDGGDPVCEPAALSKAKATGKTKGTKLQYDALPLDGSSATSALMDFPVLVAGKSGDKPGTGTVQMMAKRAAKPKLTDSDKFLFVCNPRPEGEACPVPTTTSTTVETTTTTVTSTTSTTILILPTGVLPTGVLPTGVLPTGALPGGTTTSTIQILPGV